MIAKTIIQRLLITPFVLLGVVTVTFLLLRLTPGDPAELMLHDHGSTKEVQALRNQLGLDYSFGRQYVIFLNHLLHGDLGTSYQNQKKVRDELFIHLGPTLWLCLSAVGFALVAGIPMGLLSAYKENSITDKILSTYTLFGLSVPSFWLAPVLIILFSIRLNVLPISGRDEGLWSFILPTVTLGFSLSSVIQRITRASVLEVLHMDYITVARAKGVKESLVIFKHALKNALGPIVSVAGLQVGAIATGVVITETIFDWPGLGILLYSGLRSRNYPIVQGCVLIIGFIYVAVNLSTDVIQILINPRLGDAS